MNFNSYKEHPYIVNLKNDFPAGFVVSLIALPLCLGIALASGVPLFAGIVSGVIGGIVVALISKSNLSISGPSASLTLIIMMGLDKLGNFETLLSAVLVAGIFQILLGLVKAGSVAHFIPSSVIKGMLVSIGLIFILKQLPHAIGYDAEEWGLQGFNAGSDNTFTMLTHSLKYIKWGAVLISVLSLLILILWEKYMQHIKFLPGQLIVVLLGIGFNAFYGVYFPSFQLQEQNLVFIPQIRGVYDFFSHFHMPDLTILNQEQTIITGLTIGIVATLESLLSIEALDKIDPEKPQTPLNRELIAQGIGNTLIGFLGGLPVTSAIVRSTANLNAGGRTKMASIFHALYILIFVLFLADYLRMVPLASLAAILMMVGYKLAKPSIFVESYKKKTSYFIPFVITCVAILFSDLMVGIGIGLLVGIFFVMRSNFRSAINIMYEGPNVIINFNKDVSFLNKAKLINLLNSIPKEKNIVVDGSKAEFIDHDINEIIDNFKEKAILKEYKVEFRSLDYKLDADQNLFYKLLEGNNKWVKDKVEQDPLYFQKMAKGQSPKFLWVGCSDSRVPSNEITNTEPGEMFVHRNIANMVVHTDINLLSVVQYAVDVLKVKHVIVCGHYGCGGVLAAMGQKNYGLIDNWLRNIKDVYRMYEPELDAIENEEEKFRRLVELNVIEQVSNLSKTSVIQEAWKNDRFPILHAWVYDLGTGRIKNLNVNVESEDLSDIYKYNLK
jgi:carbonic anhydrase